MAIQSLSTIQPDIEDIVQQLQNVLSGKNSWNGLLPTETGQTILELIAAVGALDQYAIERLWKEMFPQTARLDSSIHGATRFLGVRLKRKGPPSISVTFTNTDAAPVVYNAFSSFSIDGVKLFNRETLTVPASGTLTATLYQGAVRTQNFISSGRDFQTYITPESDFEVSDVDVAVTINGVSIPRTTLGLYRFKVVDDPHTGLPIPNPAFQDFTTRFGNLQVIFGTDLYAGKPQVGDTVSVKYVVTEGTLANDASLVDSNVTYTGQPATMTIVSTTGLQNGSEQISPRLYKELSPRLFAAQETAVIQQDFNTIPLLYPDKTIIDVKVQGQRDLDTTDNRYMNLAKVWLLYDDPVMTTGDFDDFALWLQKRSIYSLRYFYDTVFEPTNGLARPTRMNFGIDASVYCFNYADLAAVKTDVEQALNDFVALRFGSISRDIYRSDIIDVIKRSNRAIDYVVLNSPTEDIVTNFVSLSPSASVSNSGGTLGGASALNYVYHVTATFGAPHYSGSYETKPTQLVTATTQAGATTSTITLNWKPIFGVTSYNVYGRTSGGSLLQIATGITGTSYVDNGSVTPAGSSAPNQDLSGLRYPYMNSLAISTLFSGR